MRPREIRPGYKARLHGRARWLLRPSGDPARVGGGCKTASFEVAMGYARGASVGAGEPILLSVRLRLALTFTSDLPQPRLHSDRPTLVGDETRSPAARSIGSRGGRYHQHEPHLLPPSRHDQLQENREPPPAPAR